MCIGGWSNCWKLFLPCIHAVLCQNVYVFEPACITIPLNGEAYPGFKRHLLEPKWKKMVVKREQKWENANKKCYFSIFSAKNLQVFITSEPKIGIDLENLGDHSRERRKRSTKKFFGPICCVLVVQSFDFLMIPGPSVWIPAT